jgi:hypothetical protein
MEYWTAFSAAGLQLPYQQQMRRFNEARVGVKHRGTLPSRHDVEGLSSTVRAFLIETAPKLFMIEFDSVSLSSLVRSDEVRSGLQAAAETTAQAGRLNEALEEAAKAFRLCLRYHRFGETPLPYGQRLFDPSNVGSDLRWRGQGIGQSGTSSSGLLEAVARMGNSLGEAITIIAYNLDYDGYRYIRTYGPVIHEMVGGKMTVEWMRVPTADRAIVDRCVAFAIDAALRLEGRGAAP